VKKFIIILKILTLKEKREAFKLLVLIFIGMLSELLGIGLIIPAILFTVQPNVAIQNPELFHLIEFFGSPTQIQLVVGGMMLLLTVYFIKARFLTYMHMVQSYEIKDGNLYS
jgi:ATP-binding cassette, subfamily B, bacterial PglK